MTETNPFIRYRERLDSYAAVRDGQMTDEQWVDIVSSLDSAIAGIEGHGFAETPVVQAVELAKAAGLDVDLWIKAEPNNCLLYTSPSPRDATLSRMPSSA